MGSVVKLSITTGADKKQYEMVCLPYEFIFGWIFTINPRNVAPEAKENVLKYKRECYHALFRHFVGAHKFLMEKEKVIEKLSLEEKSLENSLKEIKAKRKKAESMTLEEYEQENRQLQFPWWDELVNKKELEEWRNTQDNKS